MFVVIVTGRRRRSLDVGEVRERIESEANQRVYACPIRLFDTFTQTVITRDELAEQLFDTVLAHVSTPPTPKDGIPSTASSKWEDLKASHDHEIGAAGKTSYSELNIHDLVNSYSRYAILSHRWSKNELRFSDIPSLDDKDTQKSKGYKKFACFTRVVKEHYPLCRYLWIDTFCINKDSSTELDESIRSMFDWYRNSHVCIVHLAITPSFEMLVDDPWFKRGWTLQELLAPRRIKFYINFDWTELCPDTLFDINRLNNDGEPHPQIEESIVNATGIDFKYIHREFSPSPDLAPLIFSWAARRQTSRPEDIAYCLVGLLNVHLPIAYGEGKNRAFGRLQVACIQSSPSRGLFSWDEGSSSSINSMLARSPFGFTLPSCDISCDNVSGFDDMDSSFTLTNAGLRIKMWLLPVRSPITIGRHIEGCLFNLDDVQIRTSHFWGSGSDREKFEKGTLVVGVLGFHAERMHAVILSKERGHWVHDLSFHIERLPSKSDLERSGVKPKRVLIK